MSAFSSFKIKDALIHYKVPLIIFAVLIVFITFLATFNWNWFRPFLVSYVSQKSERDIKIGKLDVDFSGFLNPTIQLENLYIPNASWADKRPLISAKKISFRFNALQFLLNPKARIVHVTLSDSEVNLERLNDGLRNWRLLDPNYKGLGKYLVLSLTVQRSVIRVKNHALDLDLIAKIDPNPNSNLKSQKMSNSVTFSGNYLKAPFNGKLLTDAKVTFQQTNALFNVDGFVNQGKNKVSIIGKLGDVLKDPLIDADMKISGNLFSLVNIVSKDKLAGQDAFNVSTHIVKSKNKYQVNHFIGSINGSDLKGNFSYLDDKDTPQIKGDFTSEAINFKGLLNLFKQLKKSDAHSAHSNLPKANSLKLGSTNQSSIIENLKKSQLSLVLKIKKVAHLNKITLSNLTLKANGNARKFDLKIQDGLINGGKLSANATLNVNKDLPEFQSDIIVNKLKIESLLANENLENQVSAPLNVTVNAHSKGNSLAEITNNMFGHANVTIGKGVISNKLDAKLGLDFGKLFWLSLRGDKNITLNCGKFGFDIKDGIATSNVFWVNTQQTVIQGDANINLINKQVNVLLDSQPKDPSLFVNNKSIQVAGQFDEANYAINTTDNQLKKSAKNASHQQCNQH